MRKTILFLGVLLIFASCDLFNGGGEDTHDQFQISDDKMITIIGDSVSFYEEEPDTTEALGKTAFFSSKKKDIGYDVTLVARISAVLVDGDDVQANDILISGDKAYIAYNFAGEPFKGAVQIVDISDKNEPEIIEEIKMPSMDVNALYLDGSTLIFGGAADPEIWGFKSFVGRINTRKVSPTDIASSITELPSHAVTGIAKMGWYYYVTSGAADGVISKLSWWDLSVAETLDLSDGRAIEEYDNGLVVISGTTDNPSANGQISIVSKDLDVEEEMDVVDFGSDYHKATIEVYEGDMALLALSEAGMKVLDLDNGSQVVYELPNPESVEVASPYTNSVSSDDELIFTANGAYGFRVLYNEDEDFENVSVAGYFPYNDLEYDDINYSANHIEYKSDHLFVACGVGGVQIFYLDEDHGSDLFDLVEFFDNIITDYYNENGRYPRTWGDYAYTDLGLDPDDYNNVYYHRFEFVPKGSKLNLNLEDGYTISVETTSGQNITFNSRYNWNIIYDTVTNYWYYHSKNPDKRINIDSLIITKTNDDDDDDD